MSKPTFQEQLRNRLSTFGSDFGSFGAELTTTDVVGIQKALNIMAEAGIIPGGQIAEDGVLGPQTTNGVLAYQTSQGIAQGAMDQALISSLIANVDGTLQRELGPNPAHMLTVKHVQAGLNLLGSSLAEDGQIGSATRAAIISFQSDDGLPVNGNVLDGTAPGPVTPPKPGKPGLPTAPKPLAGLLSKLPKLPPIPKWGKWAAAGGVLAALAAAFAGSKR